MSAFEPLMESPSTPSGGPLPPEWRFFTQPKTLESVVVAWSDLPEDKRKWHFLLRVLLVGVALLVGLLISALIAYYVLNNEKILKIAILIGIVAPLGLPYYTWKVTEYRGWNGFIGPDGFVLAKCRHTPENIVQFTELKWDQVGDVIMATKVTKGPLGNRYTYDMYWYDRSGKNLFTIKDEASDKNPGAIGRVQFLNAVEKAWADYQMKNHKLRASFPVKFNMQFPATIGMKLRPLAELHYDRVKFVLGKEEATYLYQDIASISIDGGILYIDHKNFQKNYLFPNKGNREEISLTQLANAQFFLLLLQELSNVPWETVRDRAQDSA